MIPTRRNSSNETGEVIENVSENLKPRPVERIIRPPKPVGMACKWNKDGSGPCFEKTGELYTKIEVFRKHVEKHFENEIASAPDITFQCVWSNCAFMLPDQDENEKLQQYYSPEAK